MTAGGHPAAATSDTNPPRAAPTTGSGPSSSTAAGVPLTSSHQQQQQPTHTSTAPPPVQAGTAPGSHSGTVVAPASSFPVVPGHAQLDPEIPKTASEAPLFGVEAAKHVPFMEQVKGHAKYYAGKFTGRDHEVQQGAAKLRGEEHTLPEDVKHPKTKAAEAEARASSTANAIPTTAAQSAGPTQTPAK